MKGVGLGGFEGGAEEQQQLRPEREALSLLKALAGTAGRGGPTALGQAQAAEVEDLSRCQPVTQVPRQGQVFLRRMEALCRVTSGSPVTLADNIFPSLLLGGCTRRVAPAPRAPGRCVLVLARLRSPQFPPPPGFLLSAPLLPPVITNQ